MRRFDYSAIKANGERVSGQIEAANRSAVVELLQNSDNFVVDVRETKGNARSGLSLRSGARQSASSTRITAFTRELGMLLGAGLPLATALSLMSTDDSSKAMSKLVLDIQSALHDGKSLHEAISAFPKLFPADYRGMVKVGEASGQLPQVLQRIASGREQDEKLRGKLLSALIYPVLLLFVGVGAVALMLGMVVPRFKGMLLNANAKIPDETQLLISLSDWLIENWAVALAAVVALIVTTIWAFRTNVVRQRVDVILLALPLTGQMMQYATTVRFCRTMGTLLESGVELQQALKMTGPMFEGRQMSLVIDQAYEALRKGQDFSAPIEKAGLLPKVATNMLRIGQETGDLAASALRLATLFEDKLEMAMQRFFIILEPSIIVLVSIFVGGVIMSIVGAVVSVNDLVL